MLRHWLRRRAIAVGTEVPRGQRSPFTGCVSPCDSACSTSCPLTALPAGVRAMILRIGCPLADASRLRALGVFEGARVAIVGHRGGLLLDVRGGRLALDLHAASSIVAIPLP